MAPPCRAIVEDLDTGHEWEPARSRTWKLSASDLRGWRLDGCPICGALRATGPQGGELYAVGRLAAAWWIPVFRRAGR